MTTKHTPGPWIVADDGTVEAKHLGAVGRLKFFSEPDKVLIAAAPRMAATLQRAAFVLAELPESVQTPQVKALRAEIVETIKQATPEYYGN